MCKSLESPIMENGKLMQTYMQLQYAVQKQSLYNSNKIYSQYLVWLPLLFNIAWTLSVKLYCNFLN